MPTPEERDMMPFPEGDYSTEGLKSRMKAMDQLKTLGEQIQAKINESQSKTPTADSRSLKSICDELRKGILYAGEQLLALKKHPQANDFFNPQQVEANKEIQANIMLAYRHLEDARMRIGKVIQAYDGGVSIYDKPKVINIIVNGKSYPCENSEAATYEGIFSIAVAFSGININGATITYSKGINGSSGTLIPNQKAVGICEGMIFNVADTSNA